MDELDLIVEAMWQNVTAKRDVSACDLNRLRDISELEEEAREKRENNLEYYDYE